MAERVERRRDELQDAEAPVDGEWRRTEVRPLHGDDEDLREYEAEQRRKDDAERRFPQPTEHDGAEARLRDAGAGKPADQRMAAARRQTKRPRQCIPDDRAHQRAEDDVSVDHACLDDPRAERLRDVQPEHRERDEVE